MSKGNYNFECPFGKCGYITCDFMGIKNEDNVVQCPTQIFNKCQSDIELTREDDLIIKETLEKVKNKNNEITFGISNDFINKCIEHFGTKGQLDILQEECAELIKACSKVKRENALENLIEELTHVAISSAVVSNIYGITKEDIQKEVDKKANKYSF